MDSVPHKMKLQLRSAVNPRHMAFSLAELVVSIGILVLMLTLAGQVFNFTVASTGQASALTEVSQMLRSFERTLRRDLRSVQPGNSMMLVQGNAVNAYWAMESKEGDRDGDPANGYPHLPDPERELVNASGDAVMEPPRADVLMFFTARKATSQVDPRVTSNVQQVVYAHAEVGEYLYDKTAPRTTPFVFDSLTGNRPFFPEDPNSRYPSPDLPAQLPAERWHLARRTVLLLPTEPAVAGPTVFWLSGRQILSGQFDFLGLINDGTGTRAFNYREHVLAPGGGSTAPWHLPAIFQNSIVRKGDWEPPHKRGELDPTPPALYANRLGQYMLPGCASFKVEWTLDPRSEFVAGRLDGLTEVLWFDPGRSTDATATLADNPNADPFLELQDAIDRYAEGDAASAALSIKLKSLLEHETYQAPGSAAPYSLAERFRTDAMNLANGPDVPFDWKPLAPDGRANTVAFLGGLRTSPDADELVADPMFPGALRITVDVFDRQRRLERPVRHVMIVPVGER